MNRLYSLDRLLRLAKPRCSRPSKWEPLPGSNASANRTRRCTVFPVGGSRAHSPDSLRRDKPVESLSGLGTAFTRRKAPMILRGMAGGSRAPFGRVMRFGFQRPILHSPVYTTRHTKSSPYIRPSITLKNRPTTSAIAFPYTHITPDNPSFLILL